jgi:hypothetical protein
MKELFKLSVGSINVYCWVRWSKSFTVLGFNWENIFAIELFGVTVDVHKIPPFQPPFQPPVEGI